MTPKSSEPSQSPQSCFSVLVSLALLTGGTFLVLAIALGFLLHAMFPYAKQASKLEINSPSPSLASQGANQSHGAIQTYKTTEISENAEPSENPRISEPPEPSIPLRVKESHPRSSKQAMTWRVLNTTIIDGKQYALFGSDSLTNPYQGDRKINEVHALLCIHKSNLPAPVGLPSSTLTPGGALRGSWSGGEVVIVPQIPGIKLTSQAIADEICRSQGQKEMGGEGFRMAEFHDGNQLAGWAGWDFWAEVPSRDSLENLLRHPDHRYWVQINDQAANPW